MKKLINSFLITGSALGLLYVVYSQKEQIRTLKAQQPINIDSLHKVIDSISMEADEQRRNVDRYDIAIERFKDDHPDQIDNIEEAFKNIE